mmetsp:Transcript_19525/g.24140  ORF Transcript_19525/g.24140 Transcript_19525/m.24140 type:complete len:218 (-) Transcript_19525:423-1076(-)
MVVIKGHLIDVTEDAPVYEVADEAGETSNSVAFDLLKSHVDVLGGDLLRGVVKRLAEVLRVRVRAPSRDLTLRSSHAVFSTLGRHFRQVLIAVSSIIDILWVPANSLHNGGFMLAGPLLQLLVALVRNDIYREVFDKLGEVAPDISHRDIQRFLHLDEPVTIGDLVGREQVLLLGHLREGVRVDHALIRHEGDGFHHQAVCWALAGASHRAISAHVV